MFLKLYECNSILRLLDCQSEYQISDNFSANYFVCRSGGSFCFCLAVRMLVYLRGHLFCDLKGTAGRGFCRRLMIFY